MVEEESNEPRPESKSREECRPEAEPQLSPPVTEVSPTLSKV